MRWSIAILSSAALAVLVLTQTWTVGEGIAGQKGGAHWQATLTGVSLAAVPTADLTGATPSDSRDAAMERGAIYTEGMRILTLYVAEKRISHRGIRRVGTDGSVLRAELVIGDRPVPVAVDTRTGRISGL